MADNVYKIEIKANVEEALNATKELQGVFNGFYMELGAMGARLATELPNVLTSAIKAFGEQEMAIQKLSSAIRSNGGNVSDVLPIYQSFASEIQRITTYGDEQVLAMQAMASAMGVSNEQMNACIQGKPIPKNTKATK